MKYLKISIFLQLMMIGIACKTIPINQSSEQNMLNATERMILINGKTAKVFSLQNGRGMQVELLSYGGILSRIVVPDRTDVPGNIMLTYDSVEVFGNDRYFFGAVAGRFANRIALGQFELDGQVYQVAKNNGPNHLHGGREGFNKKYWEAKIIRTANSVGVQMEYLSTDGEEGYPGNLHTTLTFELAAENRLSITMRATTDKPTIVNLTHHGYFNLSGMSENVLNHELILYADQYTEMGPGQIPTGNILSVEGTPFDFRNSKKIGRDIAETGNGYDHNYVIKTQHDGELAKMADVYHAATGRAMAVYSNMPGVQFFTANSMDGRQVTDGVAYTKHFGFCLEPQFFPDSPNKSNFPSPRLDPGEVYMHRIEYVFGTR
jgi:aldose 1-epimerase